MLRCGHGSLSFWEGSTKFYPRVGYVSCRPEFAFYHCSSRYIFQTLPLDTHLLTGQEEGVNVLPGSHTNHITRPTSVQRNTFPTSSAISQPKFLLMGMVWSSTVSRPNMKSKLQALERSSEAFASVLMPPNRGDKRMAFSTALRILVP